jgi:hypothetical protein
MMQRNNINPIILSVTSKNLNYFEPGRITKTTTNNNQDNYDDDGGGGTEQAERIARHQQEQERQRKLKNVISILEQRDGFPALNRNDIDDLVDGFLEQFGNFVHDLLCSNNTASYKGLDCDIDTEKEIETTLRLFPEVLSRR